MSALDGVAKAKQSRFFSTGSKAIDRLLGGGFRVGRVVEVHGRSNSGKSQLAMQTVLCTSKAGIRSLYIDTEGAFRPERLEEMAVARGWDPSQLLERIVTVRSDSSAEQSEAVRAMHGREATSRCRVVVVDTLTRNFSLELPGRANTAARQGALDVHLSEVARDAYLNGRAYLLTNRVTFGKDHDVPIGGRTVQTLVDESIRLDRSGNTVVASSIISGRSESTVMGAPGLE